MPLRKSARTVAVIRLLRHLGPLPRRRRMPAQRQPDLIRVEYFKALLPFVREAQRAFATVRDEIVRMIRDENERQGRADAINEWEVERIKRLIDQAAARAARALDLKELEEVARKFGKRTSDFQREQLDRQVRAAMSVPLSVIEAPVLAKLEGFVKENVDLIKSVHERYFDRIRADVRQALETGMRHETLAELFVERDGMAENDARRIARDQIGKLAGNLNQARQEAMGVESYVWRGMRDNRERDEHVAREGKEFKWSEPPEGGHPGEAVVCRCYADPILQPLIAAVDA